MVTQPSSTGLLGCLGSSRLRPKQAQHPHSTLTCAPVPSSMCQLWRPFFPASRLRQQQRKPNKAAPPQAAAAATAATAVAVAASKAAAGGAAGKGLLAGLLYAWHTNPASVLLGVGAFVLGVSLSIFLLASIPAMLAMRRTALAMELLLHTVREEVPETASTLRLSGLELADCIEEVSMLSNDLTQGLRSTAQAVTSAHHGVQQGVDLAGKAVTGYVVPKIRSTVPDARDKLQAALEQRAQLNYTAATIQEMARTTKTAVQRLRMGLAALGLARGATRIVQAVRSVVPQQRGRGEEDAHDRMPGGSGTWQGAQQAAPWEGSK